MRHLLLIILALLTQSTLHGQGLNFDDAAYGKIPKKYSFGVIDTEVGLPARVDLSPYAPSVMSQGKFGTCVGFSSAYYGRTILEAVSRRITDQAEIDAISFSPSFLYNAIKDSTDVDCVKGSLIEDALTYMRDNGVATLTDKDYPNCGENNLRLVKSESRIMDYIRLFDLIDKQGSVVVATKKALAEMTPVIIGFQTTPSFSDLSFLGGIWRWIKRLFGGDDESGLWIPADSNKRSTGHAVCVVGYDDAKFGGAFKIVNSYGESWGEDGYFWMTYPDYTEYTKYGYQAYLPITQDSAGVTLAGSVVIQRATFDTDNEIPCVRSVEGKTNSGSENQEAMVAYSLLNPQRSGSNFKFKANVDRLAYVYLLAASSSQPRTNVLFPVSAAISSIIGPDSQLLLPSENLLYTLDNEPGTEYMLFLFSEKELDIENYAFEMNEGQGNFTERVLTAFGKDLVPYQQVEYDDRKVNFALRGKHEGHIVPLLISLQHE